MEGDARKDYSAGEALKAVIKALDGLDDESRRRVIEAACVFSGVKVTFQAVPR